jgi:hypothetical protein
VVSAMEVCLGSSAAVPVRPWSSAPGWMIRDVLRRKALELVGRFRVEVVITASVTVKVEGLIV